MKSYVSLTLTFLITIAFLCCSCNNRPSTLHTSGYDEKEMNAAIARARNETNAFITELQSGKDSGYAVKVAITDKGKTEHFWLSNVVYKEGEFEGEIGNDPGIVSNVKIGQKWKVQASEISDWMYMRNDKIHGNYTMRPLLKTMPKQEAEQYKSMLADP